ncbi:MAG TPA: hypothetical protein VF175_16485, partial [Lacipirellula sp.]
MNVFAAGMTLALAAQLASAPATTPTSEAPPASELQVAPDPASTQQPTPVVPEVAAAGTNRLEPSGAEAASTAPLRYEPAPP